MKPSGKGRETRVVSKGDIIMHSSRSSLSSVFNTAEGMLRVYHGITSPFFPLFSLHTQTHTHNLERLAATPYMYPESSRHSPYSI